MPGAGQSFRCNTRVKGKRVPARRKSRVGSRRTLATRGATCHAAMTKNVRPAAPSCVLRIYPAGAPASSLYHLILYQASGKSSFKATLYIRTYPLPGAAAIRARRAGSATFGPGSCKAGISSPRGVQYIHKSLATILRNFSQNVKGCFVFFMNRGRKMSKAVRRGWGSAG